MDSPGNPFAAAAVVNPFTASVNPFAASASPFASAAPYEASVDVDPNAPPGTYTYALLRRGPQIDPEEVEVAHVASIEVMTVWDGNVLRVDHLTPPRSYFVGEEVGKDTTTCDFFLPGELLGARRAPIVVVEGATASLLILPRSNGTVEIPGQGKIALEDLVASGRARPSGHLAGAYELELPAGAKARMELEHSGLVFEVSAVNAGKAVPAGFLAQFEAAAYVYFALSLLVHFGMVASLAFFMPHMSGDDAEAIDRDALLMMQHLLNAQAEREQDEKKVEDGSSVKETEGGSGVQAKGESGAAGSQTTKETGHRLAVAGDKQNPDPHLARVEAMKVAAEFGMIGLLNTGAGGDPNAPTAPWGRDDSSGTDPMSAHGNLWGDAIGESAGMGGLGLSGTGEGGGGRGEGIGMGTIGTIGRGSGGGDGDGFGHGHDHLGGRHKQTVPTLRPETTTINGRLPQEVIQRIVRQNFGRFRLCYDNGLRTNPSLSGRVSVKFAIDRTGAVAMSQDGGSELPDCSVVECVVRGFSNLSFPAPDGGIVTVVYPILFSPGDN